MKYGRLLLAFAVLSVPALAFAQDTDCTAALQIQQQKLAQAQGQLSTCHLAKSAELRTFTTKRTRYLRIIDWSNRLSDHTQQTSLVSDLRERDFLLASKFEAFERCVADMAQPVASIALPPAEDTCDKQLVATKAELERTQVNVRACNKCSVGVIGSGYAQSAVEILIQQDNDARTLRNSLYPIVMDEEKSSALSKEDQWQAVRDILLPRIQDQAHEYQTSPRFIDLLENIQDPAQNKQQPDAVTDQLIQTLNVLKAALTTHKKAQLPRSQEVLDNLDNEDKRDDASGRVPQGYSGYDNAQELASEIAQFSVEARDALVSAIESAITYYEKLRNRP